MFPLESSVVDARLQVCCPGPGMAGSHIKYIVALNVSAPSPMGIGLPLLVATNFMPGLSNAVFGLPATVPYGYQLSRPGSAVEFEVAGLVKYPRVLEANICTH